MANYYANARSNYFRVTDREKFATRMEAFPDVSVHDGKDGSLCLLADQGDGGGWPSCAFDSETDDYVEADLFGVVAQHLAEGEVAVFLEAGAEKLRYICGFAVAINARGERREVGLNDIYDLAAELGPNVTQAQY